MKQRISQFFRDIPLGRKLFIAFVSLVILPVMTFSGFVLVSQQRHMTERVNSYFADSVTQLALRIDHMMEEYENAILLAEAHSRLSGKADSLTHDEVMKREGLTDADLNDVEVDIE